MANVHYASELDAHSPDLKYVYLYRDGRDVAVSFKKAIVGEKHIYHLANQWKYDQDACIKLAETIDENRFFSLNYETLITQPEATIKKLCNFLDIEYAENMLNFYTSKESKITAAAGEMWQNLEKPIISNNTGKYLKELRQEEIEIFELINQDVLEKLNYQLHTSLANTALISEDSIEQYDLENKRLKKEILVNARQSDLDKRAGQLQILKEIKARAVLDTAN